MTKTATQKIDLTPLLSQDSWVTQHAALFADYSWPAGTQLSICASVKSKSRKIMKPFFVDIYDYDAAWEIISKYAVETDTYFCVSGFEPGITGGRGRPENVVGLSSLFLDLDGDWGAHAAEVLPTREQCDQILEDAPLDITMTVATGGGLHAYALLNELIQPAKPEAEGEEPIPDTEGMVFLQRLKNWFTAQGVEYGVHVDSGLITSPVQLLRPAGSLNWKKSEPRPVTIASYNASAITTLADLDATLPELPATTTTATTSSVAPEDDHRLGTRFAHAVPVDFLLQNLFGWVANGVNKEGKTWAMRLNAKDTDWKTKPRATTYDAQGTPQKVTIFSEVLKKAWSIPLSASGHMTTDSWGLLGSVILNGDFKMAAKILAKYPDDDDGDYHDLFEALKLVVVNDDLSCDPAGLIATMTPARVVELAVAPVPDAAVARLTSMMPWTHLGVAERWLKHYGNKWKYREGFGWLVYDPSDGIYRPGNANALKRTINSTVRAISALEVDYVFGATPEEEEAAKNKLKAFARTMEFSYSVSGIVKACETMEGVLVPEEKWDADPLLLNAPLGVIDFHHDGVLLDHSPDFFMTKITKGSGDITATSHQLTRLLDGLAETDPEIPAFLQRVVGMGCLGLTNDSFCHIHGHPRSGKSCLFQAQYQALGGDGATSYSASLLSSVFAKPTIRNTESASPMLHTLMGIRWVFIDEFSDVHIEANLVRSVTGGVTITTRTLHNTPISWTPQFTIGATGNKRMIFAFDDVGTLARIAPVRINARTKNTAIDPELHRILVETQEGHDAVLAFAMKGAIAMLKGGKKSLGMADLREPKCVTDERIDYAASLDPLFAWTQECVEILPDTVHTGEVPTVAELRISYIEHCKEFDTRFTISQPHFNEALAFRGVFLSKRTSRPRNAIGGPLQVRGVFAENVRLTLHGGRSLPPKVEKPETDSEPAEWCPVCSPNPCDCDTF